MRILGSIGLFLALASAMVGCDDSRMMDGDGSMPGVDAGPMMDVDGSMPGVDAGPMTMNDAGMMQMPTSPLVDPDCTDGMFSETLPDPTADISDLVSSYSPGSVVPFVDGVLMRRYTTGLELVVQGRSMRDCVGTFLRDTSSADAVIGQLSTVVHECGHFYDNNLSSFGSNTYALNDSPLRLTCAGGDATDRGGMTFARSRIRDDMYSSSWPPCGGSPGSCDFYADIYLDGDPDNGTFEGGDQGFNMLLEETVQYVNSLATSYAFTNELNGGGGSSQRDGILNFLWYVERYLHMARLDYPTAYQHILNGDGGCWRDAILQVWGRAWLYLEITDGMSHLGINDGMLESLVMTPDLLEEIQRLRDAEGCPAP